MRYGEARCAQERETRKSFPVLSLTVPCENTAHHTGPLWGSTGVGHQAGGVGQAVVKSIYCGFHRKERVRQSCRFRSGWFGKFQQTLGQRGWPWLSGTWPQGSSGGCTVAWSVRDSKGGGWDCGLNWLLMKGALTSLWPKPQNWVRTAPKNYSTPRTDTKMLGALCLPQLFHQLKFYYV